MRYFPVFLDLRDRLCVVGGGGAVAARKAELLARAGARVLVVAPALAPTLAVEVAAGRYGHRPAAFSPGHLDGAALVVAATGDRRINAQIARHARLRGLPVNAVDDPDNCSFIVPAVIDRSPVVVAVSSGGASPSLARWVRGRIEAARRPGSAGWPICSAATARASRISSPTRRHGAGCGMR